MSIADENPVSTARARAELGCGETRMSAIKRAMGITGRYVFMSDVRKFLRANPNFQIRDAYPRKATSTRQGSPKGRRFATAGKSCELSLKHDQ
jgi:hypothetical protein